MATDQQSRLLTVCTGVLAVIAALFIASYAVWLLIEAFNGNGSPGGDALLLVAGLMLLVFSAVIFSVGIKWSRAVKTQK